MGIELKKWKFKDAESLIKICNSVDRNYLANRMPYPYTRENAAWWLDMVQKREGGTGIFRAIVADGEYVGNISVEQLEGVSCRDSNIGYLLLTDYWSRGIMTGAVRQICALAFEQLDIIRITGHVYSPNIGSKRVLEKNGFELEGVMRRAVQKNENIYDVCIYGKQKE